MWFCSVGVTLNDTLTFYFFGTVSITFPKMNKMLKLVCSRCLNNTGLKYIGPLTCRFFKINTYSTVNVFSHPYDFLSNIFFSLACFIVGIQYGMHITYKIHINQLFMLSVRLLVSSRLLIVRFWGSQKFCVDFLLCGGGRHP